MRRGRLQVLWNRGGAKNGITAFNPQQETGSWLLYREKVLPAEDCIKVTYLSLKKEDMELAQETLASAYTSAASEIISSFESTEELKTPENVPSPAGSPFAHSPPVLVHSNILLV